MAHEVYDKSDVVLSMQVWADQIELADEKQSDWADLLNAGASEILRLRALVRELLRDRQPGAAEPNDPSPVTTSHQSPPVEADTLLRARARNVLIKARVSDLADIDQISDQDFINIRGCGVKTLQVIRQAAAEPWTPQSRDILPQKIQPIDARPEATEYHMNYGRAVPEAPARPLRPKDESAADKQAEGQKSAAQVPSVLRDKAVIDLWPTTGKLLGLSKNSTYRAAHSGQIVTLRMGGKFVVPVAPLLKQLGLSAA